MPIGDARILTADCRAIFGRLVYCICNPAVRCQSSKMDQANAIARFADFRRQPKINVFSFSFGQQDRAPCMVSQHIINVAGVDMFFTFYVTMRPSQSLVKESVNDLMPCVGFIEATGSEFLDQVRS